MAEKVLTEQQAREAAFADLFKAGRAKPVEIPYVPGTAFADYWADHRKELGSAVGLERHAKVSGATKVAFQAYANAVLRWEPNVGVSEEA